MWNFIFGVFVGFVIGIIPLFIATINKDKPVGDLVVDCSDRDGPFFFFFLIVPYILCFLLNFINNFSKAITIIIPSKLPAESINTSLTCPALPGTNSW